MELRSWFVVVVVVVVFYVPTVLWQDFCRKLFRQTPPLLLSSFNFKNNNASEESIRVCSRR